MYSLYFTDQRLYTRSHLKKKKKHHHDEFRLPEKMSNEKIL